MDNIQVMKIGGSVLNQPENFVYLLNIIRDYCSTPTVFVFSAFSTLSRQLKEIGLIGKNLGFEKAYRRFCDLKDNLQKLSNQIINKKEQLNEISSKLNDYYENFEKLIFGISVTKELTNRTLDRLLSFGEYLSSTILEGFLKMHRVEAIFLDACEIITTDSNYGNAKPIWEKTKLAVNSKLIPLFRDSNLIFLPGFIGRSELGTITTMGFESSNLTALLLANILEAKSVIFWTDVEGIRTSDPKIVSNTKIIPEISFEDARVASLNGLKLIHPSMYEYFTQNTKINYFYKSAFFPQNEGTIIKETTKYPAMVIIISEPYNLYEIPNSQIILNQSAQDYKLLNIANDFSLKVSAENSENNSFSKQISIITLLNFETNKVLPILDKISKKVIFLYSYPQKNIVKLLVELNEVKEIANYLHNLLLPKK
ncbi:MAG: hypothetical protein N2560_10105 [Ignavibacteria bacterium]|nr:hypothetical protein [Ignavibacteria bacterium]